MEYVSPEGLRVDGRRPKELRKLRCQLGVLASADGSSIFEMGNTKARVRPLFSARSGSPERPQLRIPIAAVARRRADRAPRRR
jgi:ribonuclease PH